MSASGDFATLLGRRTAAICAGDADGTAACFTPDGTYHDHFYGEFKGRDRIARMVRSFFHRDAKDFAWALSGTVSDGRRAYFSGISCCELDGGLIRHYSKVFERAQVLARLGFPDERILESVKRWAAK